VFAHRRSGHQGAEWAEFVAPEHSDERVDLTLIRWMLSLTPRECLAVLQDRVELVAHTPGKVRIPGFWEY